MNGIIVGEQGDNRELFLLRAEANDVTKESSAEVTRFCRGEPGYRGLDDRPWLAGERPWRSSLDSPPPELEQIPLPQSPRARRKRLKA
jgi:hypothetical protein